MIVIIFIWFFKKLIIIIWYSGFFDFIIDSSKFINNSASLSGGVIKVENKLAIFINNTYFDNFALYGNEKAAYPIRLVLLSYYPYSTSPNETNEQSSCNLTTSSYFSENNENYSLYYDSQNCTQRFSLKNETPGVQIKTYMKFRLIDYYNQTVKTQKGGICFIEVKSNELHENNGTIFPNLIGFTTTTLIDGIFPEFSQNFK